MLFHLVHEVGNRQRWRTKETLSHASAALIADQISGIAGVTGVSANPRTGSVIVTYDTGEARAALAEYLAGLAVNPPIRRAERAAFVSASCSSPLRSCAAWCPPAPPRRSRC